MHDTETTLLLSILAQQPVQPMTRSALLAPFNPKLFYQGSALDPAVQIRQNGAAGWHSDITWETIPSDYGVFRMRKLPSAGRVRHHRSTKPYLFNAELIDRMQIQSGHPATSSTTASQPPIKGSSNP